MGIPGIKRFIGKALIVKKGYSFVKIESIASQFKDGSGKVAARETLIKPSSG